jgi:hypothetical protein
MGKLNIKNEVSIRILFSALRDTTRDPGESVSIYDSLAVLVEDLDRFFDAYATNARYMKEKTGKFMGACREVAGIDRPTITIEASAESAESALAVITSMAQWKTTG